MWKIIGRFFAELIGKLFRVARTPKTRAMLSGSRLDREIARLAPQATQAQRDRIAGIVLETEQAGRRLTRLPATTRMRVNMVPDVGPMVRSHLTSSGVPAATIQRIGYATVELEETTIGEDGQAVADIRTEQVPFSTRDTIQDILDRARQQSAEWRSIVNESLKRRGKQPLPDVVNTRVRITNAYMTQWVQG